MKNFYFLSVILFSTFLSASCQKNEDFNKDRENNIPNIGGISNAKQVEANMQSPGNVVGDIQKLNQEHDFNKVNSSVDSVSKKIIRSGRFTIQVESIDTAEHAITKELNNIGGYISTSNRTGSKVTSRSIELTIRFPSIKFDTFVTSLKKFGKIENENISTEEVTSEFIDVTARIKTQIELEDRIKKLLETKTAKLEDLVQIESKLAEVRGQIESYQGRLNYLNNQVNYSTVVLSIQESGSLADNDNFTFFGKMSNSFKEGFNGLVNVIGFLIIAIISLLPVFLIVWLIIKFTKKYYLSKKNNSTK